MQSFGESDRRGGDCASLLWKATDRRLGNVNGSDDFMGAARWDYFGDFAIHNTYITVALNRNSEREREYNIN